MEITLSLPFLFTGKVIKRDKSEHPLEIKITEPDNSDERSEGYTCHIHAEVMAKRPIRIYGRSAKECEDTAFSLIHCFFRNFGWQVLDQDHQIFEFPFVDLSRWLHDDLTDIKREYELFKAYMVDPLHKTRRDKGAALFLQDSLAEETRPEMRELMMDFLSTLYVIANMREEELECHKAFTEEFPDNPFGWKHLGFAYQIVSFDKERRDPTPEEQETSLAYYRKALEVAKACNEHYRFILFDYCRALTQFARWQELEEAMERILDDWATSTREIDIPYLEDDWIPRISDGAVSRDILNRYQQAMDHGTLFSGYVELRKISGAVMQKRLIF